MGPDQGPELVPSPTPLPPSLPKATLLRLGGGQPGSGVRVPWVEGCAQWHLLRRTSHLNWGSREHPLPPCMPLPPRNCTHTAPGFLSWGVCV